MNPSDEKDLRDIIDKLDDTKFCFKCRDHVKFKRYDRLFDAFTFNTYLGVKVCKHCANILEYRKMWQSNDYGSRR